MKKRPKVIRKWPITLALAFRQSFENAPYHGHFQLILVSPSIVITIGNYMSVEVKDSIFYVRFLCNCVLRGFFAFPTKFLWSFPQDTLSIQCD